MNDYDIDPLAEEYDYLAPEYRPEPRAAAVDPTVELVEWLRGQTWSEFAQDLARYFDRTGRLTEKQADAASRMRAKVEARNADRDEPVADPEVGFYVFDGRIFRVQLSKANRPYAKVLLQEASDDRGVWAYDGRKNFRNLTERLTLDEAAAYGLAHGYCLICGRELTDPNSVERGIGPICAGKFAA